MLKAIETAFPQARGHGAAAVQDPGLTKREWFAGQALLIVGALWQDRHASQHEIAAAAYEIADAMLAAGADS